MASSGHGDSGDIMVSRRQKKQAAAAKSASMWQHQQRANMDNSLMTSQRAQAWRRQRHHDAHARVIAAHGAVRGNNATRARSGVSCGIARQRLYDALWQRGILTKRAMLRVVNSMRA